ncbi:MAG: hypothetical protein R2749_22250 [Acidimicrobiales bacterium]
MTVGINTSPLAGRDGKKVTARLVKGRLDQGLIGNVSLRVHNTERPDQWEVQGRGELQLAVLVELMRREGFELTVGKPQVLTRTIDGTLHEPVERVSVDIPDEYLGAVTQLLSQRRGRMEQVLPQGEGWVRMDWRVPARGLIGVRTEFMTETRGTGVLNHVFDGWDPWAGEIRTRQSGTIVADRTGVATGYAIEQIQERATLFIGPGAEVYEGMIVGENSRAEDMDVNICREKKVTNIRSSTAEDFVKLVPPEADDPGAGPRVRGRRRVRGSHPHRRAPAQGADRRHPTGPGPQGPQGTPGLTGVTAPGGLCGPRASVACPVWLSFWPSAGSWIRSGSSARSAPSGCC